MHTRESSIHVLWKQHEPSFTCIHTVCIHVLYILSNRTNCLWHTCTSIPVKHVHCLLYMHIKCGSYTNNDCIILIYSIVLRTNDENHHWPLSFGWCSWYLPSRWKIAWTVCFKLSHPLYIGTHWYLWVLSRPTLAQACLHSHIEHNDLEYVHEFLI